VTHLCLADTDPVTLVVDALVVGIYQSGDEAGDLPRLAAGSQPVANAFTVPGCDLARTLHRLGATGARGEVTKLATFGALGAGVLAAVGLGKRPESAPDPAVLRRAAASATRALAGAGNVAILLPAGADAGADASAGAGSGCDGTAIRAVAEGSLLGTYRFAGYRSRPAQGEREPVGTVTICVPDAADPAAVREVERALIVTTAVSTARTWVNTAPNELRPPEFATQVAAAATDAGLDVEILDEKALADGGFGGILAVGLGSSQPPRLVRLTYRPEGAATTVALVGKGITFDSGGLSIKPSQGMWEMKADMAGAAAVAATIIAIARLRLPIAVTAYLPMAENMPSGSAYRPGDVVRMRGGKQVEVLNTDAEGRMVLGDAIALACESSPDYLVETSTLTGGQVVALGKRVAGVMGTPELCEQVRDAGERAGEPVWPMPLPDDVRGTMDSDVADLLQVSAGMERSGHMLQGGIFLSNFVSEGLPWAHIDVAGPAFHSGEPTGDWSKGATGVPVRTLLELVESLATA
jgi:leucyl aminopeptidase